MISAHWSSFTLSPTVHVQRNHAVAQGHDPAAAPHVDENTEGKLLRLLGEADVSAACDGPAAMVGNFSALPVMMPAFV